MKVLCEENIASEKVLCLGNIAMEARYGGTPPLNLKGK